MSKRILVVDDEAEIVELLRDILTSEGFEVDAAFDAESALEFIKANIYDAAMLDFNLPDMDGVMLHHRIRQMDEDLARHCIFMSGLVQSDDNLGYYTSYSGGFLSKPFDIRDVLGAIRGLIESA
ncbi:MAG: response regulator [Acidobacteriia bacterium]|nr:response regulator [Terriglobia bacterium]